MRTIAKATRVRLWALVLAAGLLLVGGADAQRAGQPGAKLKKYRSKYYDIYTDLSRQRAAEAQLRIERMAEAYYERTRGYAGKISKRLPFYLFSSREAYYAAGGIQGSGGLFDGKQLMMVAGPEGHPGTWQLMQHEGFHQFAHAVIGGAFPVWVNEGMAEYFGDSVFTGDGYVTGVIPPERLARLQKWIADGHTVSIDEMQKLSHGSWNAELSIVNYDQAWSMIYFLAHGRDGKYQEHLNRYIREISKGSLPHNAWDTVFGRNSNRAFEAQWKQYWTTMRPDPTADKYAEATVAKFTSFYARAFSQRQKFNSFAALVKAGAQAKLKSHEDDWLPPALLHEAIRDYKKYGKWSLRNRPGNYQIVCTRPNGTELIGTFKVRRGRVVSVSVKTRS